MSDKLYKLGRWSFKRRKYVLSGWLVIVMIFVGLMTTFQQPISSEFTIPGTESQATIDTLSKSFPAASGTSGRIVFATPPTKTITDYQSVIDQTVQDISKVKNVAVVLGPLQTRAISPDGHVAIAQVQFSVERGGINKEMTQAILSALEVPRATGLQAEVSRDILGQPEPALVGPGEIVGVIIAAMVLIVTLGSLAAAGMPLAVGLVAVSIGVTGIFALSGVISVSSVTPVLSIMLGLAVGIDYALFIVTKYRKYLLEGITPAEAAGRAIATAGNAVIFAALTVVIALSGLSVVGIPFLTIMGLSAAATVATTATVAVTLIPALLGFAGKRVLSKSRRAEVMVAKRKHTRVKVTEDSHKTFSYRWAKKVTKHPQIAIGMVLFMIILIALPTIKLRLAFPGDGDAPIGTTERTAYDLVSKSFGPGFNGPLIVVAELPNKLSLEQAQQTAGQLAQSLAKVEGVQIALPGAINKSNDMAILQLIPKTGPSDNATKDLIQQIRTNRQQIAGNSGAKLSVTGATAVSIDLDQKLAKALPVYIIVVVGLSLLVLLVVFRSVLVPVKATLGFLLSLSATLGALVALFQWGWLGIFDKTPVVSFLPIIVVGILFGLAMDYEFFLVSGMHESYTVNKHASKEAVINGFAHGARVVTAAAIIMVAVFSGFIFGDEPMIRMIGFALAFGILIDAFVIRMTLVPAVMALLGDAAWWLPKWLAKILPNVSIEGNEAVYELEDKQNQPK
ncbi:MMPL family transporter [Candidatus Saccharibacteria bacterium]|nr:MMPL family transporter [Candidatus Saccharibacteria bacterium]MBI3337683.1 MMPL family transporter [Candidatus Saccharibacteria bacterium]